MAAAVGPYPAVSSGLPPPSSGPVWAAGPTPPSTPRSPASIGRELRRSPQNLLLRFSSARKVLRIKSVLNNSLLVLLECWLILYCTVKKLNLTNFSHDKHQFWWKSTARLACSQICLCCLANSYGHCQAKQWQRPKLVGKTAQTDLGPGDREVCLIDQTVIEWIHFC